MPMKTKRFLAMLLSIALLVGMMPISAAAEDVPFSVVVGGESITGITVDTVEWANWDGSTVQVPCYTVTVPQGSTEATLTFDEQMQWMYYNAQGVYLGQEESGTVSAQTHTVKIQDAYKVGDDGFAVPGADGELDGISVQIPNSWSTAYYIRFEYAAAGPENPDSCLNVLADAPAAATVDAGGLYSLKLNTVFADSEAHGLTYSFDTAVSNQHTKIADGVFYFSSSQTGTYDVILTARCDEAEVDHRLVITVEKGSEGIEAQYGYDETDKSSVTVYVTMSNDGYPVMATDGTVMANLEVTVPYFDLALYGMENYYRYGTDGGSGPYTNDTVIQRPTGLHLYIYLLERYYMGLDESRCCLGTSGVLEFAEDVEVFYMDGDKAYDSNGKKALYTSGGPTSIYMVNFWGHDENLMYFRNHCYPYMSAGWGSTSDYILLSDGDAWDVGLFTNWNFNLNGRYASFDRNVYRAAPGGSVTASTMSWGTTAAAKDFEQITGLSIGLYDSEWNLLEELEYASGNTITFDAPQEAGTYYLLGLDENHKDPVKSDVAPAAARLIVGDEESGGEDTPVSRILLNSYASTLIYNKEESRTLQLTATVLPAEAAGWSIVWSSSDDAVAAVDQNGLVTAIAEGEAVITAAIGDVKAECAVTVKKFNSAPTVISGTANRAKIRAGAAYELDLDAMFTDAEDDALTYTVEVCEATGLSGSWEYVYTAIEGFDTTVTDGKFSVTFPETGIYAVNVTADDGSLSRTHTHQFTVVNNDSGVIQLNEGVTFDIYNVVVVGASTEFAEDFEIPYKGTHDTTIHHIVLSRDTVSGTPSRKMDITMADGYGWGQYGAGVGGESTFSTRADVGVFALDAAGVKTAHFLQFHTECRIHTDENRDAVCEVCTLDYGCENHADANGDKYCDVCGKWLNHAPALIPGVEDLTVKIQTGMPYQLDDVINGLVFQDPDGDRLTYESYTYRKSSDGGETWGEWIGIEMMEHGTLTSTITNSAEGTYIYEFKANDGYEDSVDRWYLTLQVMDVVPADIRFYLGQDQNYKTNGNIMPVLELYRTAGIDGNMFDYVGWFEMDGETVYVYNPADYEIIDGETDYVVIDGVRYELHDYEKIEFTNSAFHAADDTAVPSNTVVDGYNMFYVTVYTGRYSTRVYGYNAETAAYDVYLGGQSMELPREKDIYGNGGNDLYLRQVNVYTTSKKVDGTYFTADDYYAEMIMPITGSMIHAGDAYVSGSYTYFPFFSWACGNGSLYNFYVYPYDTENYIFAQAINQTTVNGTSVVNKSIAIGTAVTLTVNVPEHADFRLYFQYNNFNTKEVAPNGDAVVNGDGTKTLTFKVTKSNGNYTWRMTDTTGTYVTKAGWLASLTAATEKTYTFGETDYTARKSHSFRMLGSQVTTRDEADIQVFLSSSGFKSVSGTTRVRAYRMWQLINSDTANIMVEPDFNIQVLQGNASDLSLVSGGNALNNWIDVTPTTTDIVAVNYDAMDVYSSADNYGSHGGFFPATNPERTNVFVVTNETAGTAAAHIPFNGSKDTDRGSEWDYNYDTWFYLDSDEAPAMDFTVSGTGHTAVSYATVITNDDLESTLSGWTDLTADEAGQYKIDLLTFRDAGTRGGTVIIKMTDDTGTSYALARVAEVSVTLTNVTTPGEPFTPGDQVSVTFDGLFRSINKISGIFNPLQYNLRYTAGETEISGGVAQYQQMDRVSMTLTIPEDIIFPEGAATVDFAFTNGHIAGSMYSAASPFQSMYYITDTGVGTNFSAVGTSFVLSHMADIPITVEQKTYYDVKLNVTDGEKPITGYTVILTAPDGTVLTPDENGVYQDLGYGDYGCTIAAVGYRNLLGSLHLGSEDGENVVDGILIKTVVLEKAAEGAWDGSSVSEPRADENGVYQIGTGAELAWLAQTVNGGSSTISAVLTADIDLANYNWTPIGTQSVSFEGNLDGRNHKIYNLSIRSTTGATYQGLFAWTGSGTLSNLTVEGAIDLTGPDSVSQARTGGVAGFASGTDFVNVHADVDITIDRVKGNWAHVGGIAGYGGSFTNCSNSGDIAGYQYVGGIVGSQASSITGCFNSGKISGAGQYVAGITGGINGNIIACYNTGDITGKSNVAGIVPQFSSYTMTNCFNTGVITGSSNTGALIGRLSSANAVVHDCYYLMETSAAGIGVNGKEQHVVTMVTADTLASAEFVTAVNNGLEPPAFKQGEAHPILNWQIISIPEPAVVASGWSGYTTWILTDDGTLTISPSGQTLANGKCNMRNYWKQNGTLTLPWSDYAGLITRVVVEEGVHAVGQMAFYGLLNLETVILADSVEEIRNYAFKNCTALTEINLENLDYIREGAFYGCSALMDVDTGNAVVEDWAFTGVPGFSG